MRIALGQFQDNMAQALLDTQASSPEIAAVTGQPGFAVYRNTVMKGCIDALQANYPAVARLVGDEWFRAAAAHYVRTSPPRAPMLLRYGEGFPDFLAGFAPAAELPYLAEVARLDRYWTESHCARDARPLDPAALACYPADELGKAILCPHPAARWRWFAEAPVYTIWSRNREAQFEALEIDWRAEGALITRPDDGVRWIGLDAAGCAFLDACAAGDSIAVGIEAALGANRDIDLTRLMASLLEAGAFGALQRETMPTIKESTR
ncbi:MAG: HvfC/BufC family peptide modification chaperone [Betaproteobacteria bacterium]